MFFQFKNSIIKKFIEIILLFTKKVIQLKHTEEIVNEQIISRRDLLFDGAWQEV